MHLPIRIVFALQSVMLGAYFPRLPDIMEALHLSEWQLGICLIAAPIGTLIGFSFGARVVTWLGMRRASMWTGSLCVLTILLPANAPSPVWFFLTLVIFGISIALIEVSMNAKASEIETTLGRRMMSQCHGFWSIGLMIGAPIAGYFSAAGYSISGQFAVLSPVLAVMAWLAGYALPADNPRQTAGAKAPMFSLPTKAILPLCLMPAGIMAVEGGVLDWSGVYVELVLQKGEFSVSLVYFTFAGTMAAVRMIGDLLAERFGARNVVFVSCLSAATGMLVFVTATEVWAATLGAALIGAGSATVYPLALSTAGAEGGRSAEQNIAAIAFISFVAFLVAPPIIGFLAEVFGLRIGLGALVLSALLSASLVRAIPGRRSATRPA